MAILYIFEANSVSKTYILYHSTPPRHPFHPLPLSRHVCCTPVRNVRMRVCEDPYIVHQWRLWCVVFFWKKCIMSAMLQWLSGLNVKMWLHNLTVFNMIVSCCLSVIWLFYTCVCANIVKPKYIVALAKKNI